MYSIRIDFDVNLASTGRSRQMSMGRCSVSLVNCIGVDRAFTLRVLEGVHDEGMTSASKRDIVLLGGTGQRSRI